jgi:hypothetical protein
MAIAKYIDAGADIFASLLVVYILVVLVLKQRKSKMKIEEREST